MLYRVSVVIVFSLTMLVSACEQPKSAAPASAEVAKLSVNTKTLDAGDWQLQFTAYGHFESTEEVTISVDFSGTVEKVHFRDGQNVRAGDLLIELDNQKQGLRVRQSKANLLRARAELEKSRATYFRYRDLMATGALSREQLKQGESDYERARASVDEAEAALALAEQGLRETRIISPVDGVVDKRLVELGQTVLPGNPLAIVQVADTLRVVTYVSEREVNQLRLGDEASVLSPAVPGQELSARVELVSSAADLETGNFTVKLTVSNPERQLRPGMSAQVNMRGIVRKNVLVVDKKYLVDRNRRRVLFIYQDGVAREVEPSFGAGVGDRLPVLAGMAVGDELIISHLESLVDGRAVSRRMGVSGAQE